MLELEVIPEHGLTADNIEFILGKGWLPVWRIPIILIRIQDLKKFVTDPDSDRTLIRIRIQAITIRIQAK